MSGSILGAAGGGAAEAGAVGVSSAEEDSSSFFGSISIVAPRFTANIPAEMTDRAEKRMKPVEGRSGAVATIPISPMLAMKKWMGTQEGQWSVRPLNRGRMKYPTP